jgi:hypothetical protein
MSPKSRPADIRDWAAGEIAACALDEAGLHEQRARYARIVPHVTRIEREPQAAVIEFDEDFDHRALEQALAVERECCPFFEFVFDEQRRLLRATVEEDALRPALDAITHALGGDVARAWPAPSTRPAPGRLPAADPRSRPDP